MDKYLKEAVADLDKKKVLTLTINKATLTATRGTNFGVTKLATTGGFLRAGNTTLLVGVDDNRFEGCLHIIEKLCKSRRQMATSPLTAGGAVGMYTHMPIEVTVGGATVFVLNVEQFAKF